MNCKSAHDRAGLRRRVGADTPCRSTRRAFIFAAVAWPALGWAGASRAEVPEKVRRIGLLSLFSPSVTALWHQAFQLGLRDLGWVEGKNISIEYRYAEGSSDPLPVLAADLVRLKVDVIVGSSTPETLAAKKATGAIPIVMVIPGDPVESGLVESLARPGGNVTGLTQMSPQLAGKRLELLKEIVPGLSRVAVLWNPQSQPSKLILKELQLPARRLGIELHSLEVRSSGDFDKVFQDAIRARVGALIPLAHPLITTNLKRIADFASRSRLASIYQFSYFVDDGGLMAYGPDRADLYRRAATYIDRLLKGAKPADLPVEQPTKFELAINLKTAKALGITIPPSVLLRADKVIE
jgi:putative tryptophan/tyrosine transport system substrate-binding protein